jgi:hypothetical protein
MKKSNAFQIVDGKLVYSFQSRKRFMSNLYLAVEKVTESLVGTANVNLSLVLEASDKRREGVARSVGPLLTYLPMSNGNYDLCCLSPAGVFFMSSYSKYSRHCILPRFTIGQTKKGKKLTLISHKFKANFFYQLNYSEASSSVSEEPPR